MLDKVQTKILIKELNGFIQKVELQTTPAETVQPFVNELKDIFLKHIYQVEKQGMDYEGLR
jgi:hypothetical protein